MDVADGGTVLIGHRAAGAAQEDVGQGRQLQIIGAMVDVENDLPPCRRLDVVAVAQRQHDSTIGQIDEVGSTLLYVPRDRTKADAVRRRATWLSVHAPTRTDRIA